MNDIPSDSSSPMDRRGFLRKGLSIAAGLALGGVTVLAGRRAKAREGVWQIDPDLCVQCERCALNCVAEPSAVKCVHNFNLCGYCKLCFGYFLPGAKTLNESAGNQLCPTGAIGRRLIEAPYFEYTIDETLCIGCGRCVKGCGAFGNGSLYLQIRPDLCRQCNECGIAAACPSRAIRRIPADQPYLHKGGG